MNYVRRINESVYIYIHSHVTHSRKCTYYLSLKHTHLCYLQIVGCRFVRDPPDSTVRYTKWANEMTERQLNIQIYTSHGPTVIMPTWFCHKSVFERFAFFLQ